MAITATVEQVLDHLDLYDHLYPTNYAEEKQRFFSALEDGEEYNPQYTYQPCEVAGEVGKRLSEIEQQIETSLQERLLEALRGRHQLIQAIGTPEITPVSKSVYGFPDKELVEQAQSQFSADGVNEEKTVSAETLQEAYYQLFDELGMEYDCTLIDAESIRNDPHAQAIKIPRDGAYGVMQAKRALIHESTHSVRTYNGLQQNDSALVYGTAGYETAEEGLPTFNEYEVGVFDDTLPRITSRVIAIASSDKSFYDLYRQMCELGLGQRLAFIRTYRIKRGLTDTAQPGGFIKDHIYFQGYSQLAAQPDLANTLYIGKISFKETEMVNNEPTVTRNDHLDAYRTVEPLLSQ